MFQIDTERMILRDWQSGDFADACLYAADPEVSRYMAGGPNSERETRDFVYGAIHSAREKPRCAYELAVELKTEKKVIGGIGLSIKDPGYSTGFLGYAFNRDYWGQGLCSEASLEMLRFGFEDLDLHRIFATCDTRNEGSRRVLEKSGMRREAHFLEDSHIKGAWRDSYLFAILKREWLIRVV